MMRNRRLFPALAFSLTLATAGLVARSAVPVPIRAAMDGLFHIADMNPATVAERCPTAPGDMPPVWVSTGEFTGNFSHLGFVRASYEHCLRQDMATYDEGRAIFVAANGDELYTRYGGYPAEPPDMENMIFRNWALHTIVGGTGRFSAATGAFTDYVVIQMIGPPDTVLYHPVTVTSSGLISY
jgi:hypothetical protein